MRAWNLALLGALVGCGDKDPSASNADDVVVLGDTGLHDVDGDGYTDAEDCDDEDPTVHPGAEELCDGVDNDCDDEVDEDASAWYADADGDGYGDPDDVTVDCAAPSGYVDNDLDCDDSRDDVNPNFPEVCNGVDDDCDGVVDGPDADGATAWYADADGDGYGDATDVVIACDEPSGYCADDTDCDDTSADAFPGGTEVCDGVDNDCDGSVDGPDAADATDWYADTDGDGYGDAASSTRDCSPPSGHVDDATDCDDTTALAYPGADERCDGIDNDCEGDVDESDAIDASTWYADDDGDGYGDAADATVACTAPSGTVSDSTDCDDTDAAENPAADEVCDGDDDDCDGSIDEADAIDAATWYADADADGYGDASVSTVACDEPSGYTGDATDCDDADAGANPGEDEVCDGDDDDCDGVVDESDAIDAGTWYTDGDGDGYGDDASGVTDCTQPSGTIATGGDCLDSDGTVYPGATEVCGDGVVNDCDSSATAADAECDDWGTTVSTGDAGAVFTATTTNWFMGINPAPVGDVDGDGIADVLLGSSLGSPGGVSEAGSTHLFHGPVSGTLPLSTADVIVAGRRAYDNAASSGAGLGDLDGDGYADILIGGPGSDEGTTGSGTAWLLHGPVTSTSVTAYDLRLTSSTRYAQLGPARAPAGDQDGDGVGDLLIGAAFHGTYEGAAYVVPGDLTGARSIASAAIARIDGDVASDFLGRRVEGATDLDGDGQADIVIGCQDCGTADASAAYVFFGPVTGTLATADADVHVTTGNNDDLSAGISAGDLDGDGQDDLALGAPNASPSSVRAGSLFVWAGPLSGGTLGAADAVGRVDGTGTNDRVGGSVDVATLDDDGAQDLLFASGFMNVTTSAIGYGEGTGEAWAMYGPISGSLDVTDAEHRFEGPDIWFGTGGITGVGDMTGDGRAEVLITSGYIAKSAWLFVAPGY